MRIVSDARISGSATRRLKRGCYIVDNEHNFFDRKKTYGTIAVLSVGGVDCVGG